MIYLDEPEVIPDDIKRVQIELEQYPFSTRSQTVHIFEEWIKKILNVNDCVAVNSGTSALHLSLLSCGVKRHSKVLMPATSFVATANAVKMCGGEPIFCDVDQDTWNITDETVVNKIQTEGMTINAIIGVDLYGNPFNLKEYGYIPIIADSAESLGSVEEDEENVCEIVYGCFSFNGNKIVTTGAGGCIVGDDLSRVRIASDIGRSKGEVITQGYNYRMTGMQAALGLHQLICFNETLKKKRRINEIYRNESPTLKFQEATKSAKPNWWMTAALFGEDPSVEKIQELLANKGIPTRRIFKPINQEPFYRDGKSYQNAEHIYKYGLCLPSSVKNSEKDIMYVCETIKKII